MTNYDAAVIQGFISQGEDKALTAKARGDALENLFTYLLNALSGVQTKCKALDRARSSEVDITVLNCQEGWLKTYPTHFLVECKNWEKPVDSQSVASFASKVRNRGAELGILVTVNGLTGDPDDLTSAYNIIQNEQSQRIRIILITLDQLRGVKTTNDFELLLCDRFLATAALTFN